MSFVHNGRIYRSKKHPLLEYIFNKYILSGPIQLGENIPFTLSDIIEAYNACGIQRPGTISNTILDLTRKNSDIESRLPPSLIEKGYDLRKKTGSISKNLKYEGEFVFVGIGNALSSWLVWPPIPDKEIIIINRVPQKVIPFLGKDEGALFSVIDYCDLFSLAIYQHPNTVVRVQNPMKWQPNEVDGLYFSDYEANETLFPVEAKALSTHDDLNLEQVFGAYQTLATKLGVIQGQQRTLRLVPLGVQMIKNGINLAIFEEHDDFLRLNKFIRILFEPPIPSWH